MDGKGRKENQAFKMFKEGQKTAIMDIGDGFLPAEMMHAAARRIAFWEGYAMKVQQAMATIEELNNET